MKKIYTTLLTLAAATSLTLSAQQLPNADFEGEWVDSKPWSSTNPQKSVDSTQPANWCISNTYTDGVPAFVQSIAKIVVGNKVTGNNSNNAVELKNVYLSGQTVPAYVTLGTTWATAAIKGSAPVSGTEDGGTWGGIDFVFRPDALQFDYKHSQGDGSTQPATAVVYLWKGHTTQTNVPGNTAYGMVSAGKPTNCTMTNRDRNILQLSTTLGDIPVDYSTDFELIGSNIYSIKTTNSDWESLIVPINYNSTNSPEKINVILSAADYFADRANHKKDDALTIDNIRLIYYSRLETISINGTPVKDFNPDTFDYTINGAMPSENAISFVTLGNSKSANTNVELDEANSIAKITVTNTNDGGTDVDGQTSHVYSIKFNNTTEGGDSRPIGETHAYDGSLQVTIDLMGINQVQENQTIHITQTGSNTCTFKLNNFAFDMNGDGSNLVPVGNIVLENVTITLDGTTEVYNGSATNMWLGPDGASDADKLNVDVTLNGTIDASGHAIMNIEVLWHYTEGSDSMDVPINVVFNGNFSYAGIGGIEADNTDAPVEYYNLQGVRIAADNLTPGIYIRRQGTEVTKILIRK